ncbi:MAG TPA: PepSY domain-containing protein, partial [Aquabacterium sp.]|nr:PepSY domain-containing protein [Aquabacterium sp.]
MSTVQTAGRARAPLTGGPLFLPARWRRAEVLRWLRRTHAWCGLWGGVFGLLFGATGILLNHRAVMKLPVVQTLPSEMVIQITEPRPATPEAMRTWLAHSLDLQPDQFRMERQAPEVVGWGNSTLQQPERWEFNHSGPKGSIAAEYWVGNTAVSIKRKDGNAFYLLTRLHMAQGVHPVWILAADSIAGCLILLSITGTLMWSRLH